MPPRRIPGREAWTSERESRRSESKHQSSSSSRQNESEHQSSSSSSSSSSRRSARNRRDDTTSSQHQSSFFQSTSSSATSARRSVSRDRITAHSLIPSFVGQNVVDEEVEASLADYVQSRPSRVHDLDEYFMERTRITGVVVGSSPVLSSPFFELHSVEIVPDTERTSLIYGQISLTDGNGNSIDLYKKEKDEAEFLEGSSELWLGDSITVVPLKFLRLSVCLLDKNLNSTYLVDRSFNIDLLKSDDFWDLKKRTIYGNCGHVTIRYRSMIAAITADLSVTVSKESSDADDDDAYIYGTIRSRRDPPFQNLGLGKFDITHFEVDEDEPVKVEDEECLSLYRSQLIVPTCSSVTFSLKLFDASTDDIIVKGTVKFKPFEPVSTRRQFCSANEKWSVVVEVDWSLLEDELQIPSIENLSLAPHNSPYENPSSWLVEIYSISIDNAVKDAYIRGNVTVRDDNGVSYIFKNDNFAPDFRLWWPSRCLQAVRFRMNLKLQYGDGSDFNGYLDLSYQAQHFDTRLCSVIRDELSFATIHYCVFKSCQQGNVSIWLVSPNSVPMDVDGRIVAQTSNFENTVYNNKFYRNVLFEVPKENIYYCQSESYLPLQKSAIVGPRGYSVTMTFDVGINEAFATHRSSKMCGEMEFEIGYNKTLSFTSNNGFMINVRLEWVEV